jgi:hypothetical protein
VTGLAPPVTLRKIVRSETDLQFFHLLHLVDGKVSFGDPRGYGREQIASVERGRQHWRTPDDSPGLRFRGARGNHGQQTVVRPHVPFAVRLKDHRIAVSADTGIDEGQEHRAGRKPVL